MSWKKELWLQQQVRMLFGTPDFGLYEIHREGTKSVAVAHHHGLEASANAYEDAADRG